MRLGPSPAKSRRSWNTPSAPSTTGVRIHSTVVGRSWRPIAPRPTTTPPAREHRPPDRFGQAAAEGEHRGGHDQAAHREHRTPHHEADYRARVAEVSSVRSDLRLILWVQALRAFAYGFGVVVLGTSLASSGLSDADVTLVFTAMLAGMAIASIVVGEIGDRLGRRRLYAILLALMGVSGVVFALTNSVWLLCLVSLTGTMSTDANESGPITSIEQAMIGQASAETRIQVFGRYNAVAYLAGAMGSLAAGGPAFLRDVWHSAPSRPAVAPAVPGRRCPRRRCWRCGSAPGWRSARTAASARWSGRAATCSRLSAPVRDRRVRRADWWSRRSSSSGSRVAVRRVTRADERGVLRRRTAAGRLLDRRRRASARGSAC